MNKKAVIGTYKNVLKPSNQSTPKIPSQTKPKIGEENQEVDEEQVTQRTVQTCSPRTKQQYLESSHSMMNIKSFALNTDQSFQRENLRVEKEMTKVEVEDSDKGRQKGCYPYCVKKVSLEESDESIDQANFISGTNEFEEGGEDLDETIVRDPLNPIAPLRHFRVDLSECSQLTNNAINTPEKSSMLEGMPTWERDLKVEAVGPSGSDALLSTQYFKGSSGNSSITQFKSTRTPKNFEEEVIREESQDFTIECMLDMKLDEIQSETKLSQVLIKKRYNLRIQLSHTLNDLGKLATIHKQCTQKQIYQEQKKEKLESEVEKLRQQLQIYRYKLEANQKDFECEMYKISKERQQVRSLLYQLRRECDLEKADEQQGLLEQKEQIKNMQRVLLEASSTKDKITKKMKKNQVSIKERQRSLSVKKAKINKYLKTVTKFAKVDLSQCRSEKNLDKMIETRKSLENYRQLSKENSMEFSPEVVRKKRSFSVSRKWDSSKRSVDKQLKPFR